MASLVEVVVRVLAKSWKRHTCRKKTPVISSLLFLALPGILRIIFEMYREIANEHVRPVDLQKVKNIHCIFEIELVIKSSSSVYFDRKK